MLHANARPAARRQFEVADMMKLLG